MIEGPAYDSGYSMVDFLREQQEAEPKIAVFLLEWMKTDRSFTPEDSNFSICSSVRRETAKLSTLVKEGKYAMIPSRVKGAWVHYPMKIEDGYVEKKFEETSGAIFFHLNKPVWSRPTVRNSIKLKN
ncbi:unnamed protein product [Toxocara canis]|uniref:Glycosyltransferase family 92 protein n=1 Tax=Toxocara canis TaxID=6265 RepID=A0A183VH51_TOXCA|nr:unnamed protein product [Toxocara canis]